MRKALKMIGCLFALFGCMSGKAVNVLSDSTVQNKVTITFEQYDYYGDVVVDGNGRTLLTNTYFGNELIFSCQKEFIQDYVLTETDIQNFQDYNYLGCSKPGEAGSITPSLLQKNVCLREATKLTSGFKVNQNLTVFFAID